jgi:hypothetical protein
MQHWASILEQKLNIHINKTIKWKQNWTKVLGDNKVKDGRLEDLVAYVF